jgi:hypothetical protein
MMTPATADPLATAAAIVETARRRAEGQDRPQGAAAVVALAGGVVLSLIVMAAMVVSPAAIPMWCAAHGGCP